MNLKAAKQLRGAACLLMLLALSCSGSAFADQETDQLRAENLRLKAQLQAMQQSCASPATAAPEAKPAASVPAAAPPAAAAAGASAAAAAAIPAPASTVAPVAAVLAPAPTPVPAAATKAATASQAVPQGGGVTVTGSDVPAGAVVPKGYKLVPDSAPDYVSPLSPPYNRTGCSRDLTSGPPPAKWNDASNWLAMRRGLKPAEVENLLGKEHFDAASRDRLEWQYGRCGDAVSARVEFENNEVQSWQAPDL